MTCSTAIFIFIGLALCSHGNSQETAPSDPAAAIMEKVSEIANIPGLNETASNQVENAKNKIKEKCEKNGGSFDKLSAAKDEFETCLKGLIDVNLLQEEIEKAKPHGELDSVFHKYCKKNVTLIKCMTEFITVMEPCLETEERQNIHTLPNVTQSFLNFICHKEGDRIALFIAAGGPECFQEKQIPIQNCFNSTYGGYVPNVDANGVTPSFESLPSLVFSLQQCNNAAKLQECVVKELEKCNDPTPGNMADALFTFVKNATPCHEILQARADASVNYDYHDDMRSSATKFTGTYSIVLLVATVILKYV
ncbi:hypothetical protein PV325_008528 [Microctonus aethiopoides]|uniref:27 kDa hemolymph protein n=1 Tax=Microctonus aethiopoides TaxID=144406 RepID=A0AA39KWK1_9HYME|nr:hypothetical protein PV325_008528 [Microctonus aethiopoides]KAK0093608.1 hypothetical protein PV326_013130 [Microctonus aethiopoides]KAK0176410.1 hypothetical protein PV328_000548 [Microctonus aethiopoides]